MFIRTFPVESQTKYHVSWYIKTQGVGTTNGGATVDVNWYDSTHTLISSSTNIAAAVGTKDWMRKGARVNAPANAAYAKVVLDLNAAGTAWFDNVQMEIGTTINQYNLINNSSFEQVSSNLPGPDFWDMGTLESGDGVVSDESHTGLRSILVNGASGKNKYFSYEVNVAGAAGESLFFSGWSKAAGVSPSGGDYGLLLFLKYSDGTEDWIPAAFTKSTHGWEFTEEVFYAQKDFAFFGIYGKLEDQSGQVWFDDFTLRFASAANALISPYSILQNDSFEKADDTGNWPDYWPKFTDTSVSGTYDVSWLGSSDDLIAFRENKMIRISNVPGWAVVANAIYEPLQAGKTYTAYAAIKTDGVSGAGAVVNIDILDASGTYLSQKTSKAIIGTTYDWTVVSVSLSESEAKTINPNAAQLRVSVGTGAATSGVMYFDMVRLIDQRAETTYEYTGNYVTAITDVMGNRTSFIRDGRGNATSQTDPKGYTTQMEYDLLDQKKAVEIPSGRRTEYAYDENGNVTQITNKNKSTGAVLNTTSTLYNELGLVKRVTDPLSRITAYEYDKNSNLTRLSAANGKDILHTSYDNVNRLKNVSYVGDSTTWAFSYDRNDNLISVTKNGSAQTQYTYDLLDRLETVTYPSIGGIINSSAYAYTPTGQLLSLTHSPVSTTQPSVMYEYDRSDMIVNLFDPNNGSVEYVHDTEGRLTKSFLNGPSNYFNYRDYNGMDQLTRVYTEDNAANTFINITYEYDANGNMVKETNLLDNSYVTYEYDNILTAEKYYNSSGTLTRQITYQYDLLGNRTQRTIVESGTSTTITYHYDAANQLTTSSVDTYTFDANGNMTQGTRTYVYNAEN